MTAQTNALAERSVLGACLLDRTAIGRIADFLKPEHFADENREALFRAMLELYENGKPLDIALVSEQVLRRHKDGLPLLRDADAILEGLMLLESEVPTSANVEHYARVVEELAMKRALISIGSRIAALGQVEDKESQDLIDEAETLLFRLADSRTLHEQRPINVIMASVWERAEAAHRKRTAVTGIPSGFRDIDAKTGGFQPSNLILLAARPSIGKTALVMNIAEHIAVKEGLPVAVFSLEMSAEELMERAACAYASLDHFALRQGHLTGDQWNAFARAHGALSEAPIILDDSPSLSVMELRARARRYALAKKVRLVIVDYLQLLHTTRHYDNRVTEVTEISRALKNMARELEVPVIAVSQLNREVERAARKPQLSDLRDSGALEQDADLAMFLHRDKDTPSVADLIIAKHRNGPTGTLQLVFRQESTRFFDYAQTANDEEAA